MSEENDSQPATEMRPETEARADAPPRERHRRPRRRFPRRRGSFNSEYSNDRYSNYNNDAPAEQQLETTESGVTTDVEGGEPAEPEFGDGIIEISGKGFGFLRDAKRNFVQAPQDIFVTPGNRKALRLA